MAYTVPARGTSSWDEPLQTLFDQIDADMQSAGTGTAKMRIQATTPSSPYDGLVWVDTSQQPPEMKVYDNTNTKWFNPIEDQMKRHFLL